MKMLKKLVPPFVIILVCMFIFKGLLPQLNQFYFSSGGDGLKAYYCAWYHAQFDENNSHFTGMNYPWGESYYFTDGQPPVTNTIRLIHHYLFPLANLIPGIFNFLMLLSVGLTAIFLFLIFKKFKIPDWFALIVSLGVTFLSPQMGRLPVHFSLSWGFWIPLMIYLTLLMIEKQSWLKSILFAIVVLIASLMHMYFFLFAVALMSVFWFNTLIIHKENKNRWIELSHFTIQIIVPFVLLQIIMVDDQVDRTIHPYGFYAYRAYPGSIFLPVRKWYVPFLWNAGFVKKYTWEAFAYIGMVASVGFFIITIKWLINLFSKTKKEFFLQKRATGILFWASILLLLFSFGIPFILGLEKLRTSIGFLSQLRAVGRFSWLFYYVINILVWIMLYRWAVYQKNKIWGYSVIGIMIFILLFEAYDYSKNKINVIENRIAALSDIDNRLEENDWVSKINPNDYQAIMPLPYFHIGSESTWIEPQCGIDRQMYIVSMKTGLPCNGVMLGRTSLKQTYKNVALSLTPWEKYEVLDDYHNNKPLMLLVANCDNLNTDEKRLVSHASFITSAPKFDLYSLEIETLKSLPLLFNFPEIYKALIDSTKQLIIDSTAYLNQNGGMYNSSLENAIQATRHHQPIVEAPVKLDTAQNLYIRFWIKDYTNDLVARTQLLVIQSSPDHQTLNEMYTDIFRHIRTLNGNWALVEIELQPKQKDQIIKVLFKNSTLAGTNFYFDDFSVSQLEW